MDKRKLSHDILNMIERLRIMHDLAREQNYSAITKEELKEDLDDTLRKLNHDFQKLMSED